MRLVIDCVRVMWVSTAAVGVILIIRRLDVYPVACVILVLLWRVRRRFYITALAEMAGIIV